MRSVFAPIVGRSRQGLVLEDLHSRDFVSRGDRALDQPVEPIASVLVPVFFVLMGLRTDLRAFADSSVLGLAAARTLAAVAGKQLCMFGVIGRGLDKLSVGSA
jgi:Kef-type K+ transport system membrane component KefB